MSTHARIASLESVVPPRSRFYNGFFGRLFPDLEPWDPFESPPSDADADDFFKGIAEDRMIEAAGADLDSEIPAGYTYFGQFIDHDITFDPASSLVRLNDPNMIHNFRTPRLDLDNVYGRGPAASPHLYDTNKMEQPIGRFLIGKGKNAFEPDLPRNHNRTALIGDPRNDENIIVSQLQLAFLKFHNRVFDEMVEGKLGSGKTIPDDVSDAVSDQAYREARRIVTWTYQYVVWNDFVKRIINNDLWSSVLELPDLAGRQQWKLNTLFYDWRNTPFMPIEFSAAAYRFGHSLVRNGYQLNFPRQRDLNPGGGPPVGVEFEIPIFDLSASEQGDEAPDLRGGRLLPKQHTVQWDWFLAISSPGSFPQQTRKIDQFLSPALTRIPAGPSGDNPLAFLNLKRGWRMGLPSGPDVARHIGVEPIDDTQPEEEALWFYILKEAGTLNGGNKLGPVGSTIVGEVFAGLLAGDPNSYFSLNPLWTPSDEPILADKGPSEEGGSFEGDWELRDIILIAQMPKDGDQVDSLFATT